MDQPLVEYLETLYMTKGARSYGLEPVSQLEHALQCAFMAEDEGAGDDLVAASLLHDLGHLVYDTCDTCAQATPRPVDDRHEHHEHRPIRMLRRHFGEPVLAPIRLHVAAKRYLCAIDPDYRAELSAGSQRSLEMQGGAYTPDEARAFIALPYAVDAVRLRTWDDRAKIPGKPTPGLGYFMKLLRRCAHEPADLQSQT